MSYICWLQTRYKQYIWTYNKHMHSWGGIRCPRQVSWAFQGSLLCSGALGWCSENVPATSLISIFMSVNQSSTPRLPEQQNVVHMDVTLYILLFTKYVHNKCLDGTYVWMLSLKKKKKAILIPSSHCSSVFRQTLHGKTTKHWSFFKPNHRI